MPEQARVVDINVYYRTGGVSREKVVEHNDACILQTGLGRQKVSTLDEQRSLLEGHLPLAYYHVISRNADARMQADDMLNWVGSDVTIIIDLEALRGTLPTFRQVVEYANRIEQVTGRMPWLYSRRNIMESVAPLHKFSIFDHIWGAGYPFIPGTTKLYRTYEAFLERYAWRKAPYFTGTPIEDKVILWQFTREGDARKYAANEHTQDPIYTNGMVNCDLSVSLVEKETFLSALQGDSVILPPPPPPPPPPPEPEEKVVVVDAWALNMRDEPSTSKKHASVQARTWRGRRLPVIAEEDGWYQVALWVHGGYVHEEKT